MLRHAIPILLLSGSAFCQVPDHKKAEAEFQRAVKAVAESKYGAAFGLYKQVAKNYPNTAWGKLAVLRTQPTAYFGHGILHRNGEPQNRVDVVIMGDGYGLDDQNEFEDVARSAVDVFRNHKLLGEYFAFHNFVRVNLTSKDQGVTGFGRTKDTALGGFVTGHVQGQVGVDGQKAHKMLDQLDHHDGYAIAIVKAGSMGTGGGGIAAIGGRADETMVHEWGHAFGGLSDEYSSFTGHRGSPRDTVNISTTDDEKRAPWRHLIEAGVPGVGTYRGGDGRLDGAWRPTASGCTMEDGTQFCPVCREQMVLQIYRRVDPIDAESPPPNDRRAPLAADAASFALTLLQPKTHQLDVRFHVLPEAQAVAATAPTRLADRRTRGPLAPIPGNGAPAVYAGNGRYTWKPPTSKLPPGRYQVVCRVRDDAKPSGQQWPWVVKDDRQLLQSERIWWFEVAAK